MTNPELVALLADRKVYKDEMVRRGPGLIQSLSVGMSLRSIADEIGYSVTYLSRIKNGQSPISYECFTLLVKLQEQQ